MRLSSCLGSSMLAGALIVALTGAASAQQPAAGMSREAELLSKMHASNQTEIRVGEMAMSKGTTAEIRRFGQLLVRDHQFADQRITDLASRQNIQLVEPMPKSPEERQKMEMQKQMVADLETAQGPEFDRKFIEFNQMAHENAVDMVTTGHTQLEPSPVKTLTGKMAPILQQHKDIADNLSERQRGGAS